MDAAAPPRRPRGPPVSPRAVVADAAAARRARTGATCLARDPLAEVERDWSQPHPDARPRLHFLRRRAAAASCIRCREGPDAFYRADPRALLHGARDFFAGPRGCNANTTASSASRSRRHAVSSWKRAR